MSVNLTNTDDFIPYDISAGCGNVESTKAIVERGAAFNSAKKMWRHSIDSDCTK